MLASEINQIIQKNQIIQRGSSADVIITAETRTIFVCNIKEFC